MTCGHECPVCRSAEPRLSFRQQLERLLPQRADDPEREDPEFYEPREPGLADRGDF